MQVVRGDDARGVARREEVGGGDEGAKDAGYGGEEAKDILDAVERVVHAGRRRARELAGAIGAGSGAALRLGGCWWCAE